MREEFESETSGRAEWLVDPGLVGRPAWDVERAEKDVELLRWIGRFRFVTGKLVAEKFGISWQRANARLRRLERLGLVRSERRHVCEARAVFLTSKGSVLLGGERRRAPRAETHREHELAIVVLATSIEHDRPDLTVVTEHECRRRDRNGDMRWSVDVHAPARGPRHHWPDLVVTDGARRTAVEIEFAPKASDRLADPRRLQRG